MYFQIVENFGSGAKGYLYFEIDSEKESDIILKAIKKVRHSYKENASYFSTGSIFAPDPPRPTITIREYDNVLNKKVRGGMVIKTKWR